MYEKKIFFLLLAISTKCGKNKDKKNYGRFKNNNNNRTTHQQYIQCDDDEELAVFKVFFLCEFATHPNIFEDADSRKKTISLIYSKMTYSKFYYL